MSDLKLRLRSYLPTSANRALAPALGAGLLALGLVAQLGVPADGPVPPDFTARRAPQWPLPALGRPAAPLAIEAQSLFLPDRAAAAIQTAAGPGTAAATAPVGPLAGAFVIGSERLGSASAVLLRDSAGHVVRLAPGRAYKGWQLVGIGASEARFHQPGAPVLTIPFGTTAPNAGATSGNAQ